MSTFRTIPEIVKDCGGARRISAASLSEKSKWPLKIDAIYKWSITGIPDRHWTLLMSLTDTSAEELHAANCAVRGIDAAETAA